MMNLLYFEAFRKMYTMDDEKFLWLFMDSFDMCFNGTNIDIPIGIFETEELAIKAAINDGYEEFNNTLMYVDSMGLIHTAKICAMPLNKLRE